MRESRRESIAGYYALWLVVLPVLYVLSIGPVGSLLNRLDLSLSTHLVIAVVLYYPLFWLAEAVPAFGDLLQWYMDLWP